MPARSRRQQRYLYARFGSSWVHEHHYDQLAPGAPKSPKAHAKLKSSMKGKKR